MCVLLTRHFFEIGGYPVQFVIWEYTVAVEHLNARNPVGVDSLVNKTPVAYIRLHLVKKAEWHSRQLYQALQVSV